MPLLDPQFSTRRRLKAVLTFAGVVAGAVFGIALTRIGKIATGAPPAMVPAPIGLGLFLILPPVGLIAGFAHLQRRYPDRDLAAERTLPAAEYLHPRIK